MIASEIDAIHADVGLVRIRSLADSDRGALLAFNTRISDQSLYRRFFYLSRYAADAYVDKLLRPTDRDHHVLVAVLAGEVIGVASFERIDTTSAEIALLIEDRDQHEGIGTLLMAQLTGAAREVGIHRFIANVLAENSPMIRFVRRLGFPTTVHAEGNTVVMGIDIELSEHRRIR
jgi:RimJ/RimL family protein N-acetyltransferase